MQSVGASADDVAPSHKIKGESDWLQRRGIGKSLLATTTIWSAVATVRWTPRDNSAPFPDIFVRHPFVCFWAPVANGQMSHFVAMSCWSNQIPRGRNRLCNIFRPRASHRSAEVSKERATFSAGSFECLEETFRRIEGVQETMLGYAGGWRPIPATSILLDVFWGAFDPMSFNRQEADVGTQYRSVIFFHSPEEEAAARASKERLRQSGRFTRPIITKIVPATRFYRPEK